MKEIKVMRAGRPATIEEILAAVEGKPLPPVGRAREMQQIYLMGQRKAWHHKVPAGWKQVAWERFDYIECAIYEKPVADLTKEDLKDWVSHYGNRPCGWIEPEAVAGQVSQQIPNPHAPCGYPATIGWQVNLQTTTAGTTVWIPDGTQLGVLIALWMQANDVNRLIVERKGDGLFDVTKEPWLGGAR